jgi:hypothetical protein
MSAEVTTPSINRRDVAALTCTTHNAWFWCFGRPSSINTGAIPPKPNKMSTPSTPSTATLQVPPALPLAPVTQLPHCLSRLSHSSRVTQRCLLSLSRSVAQRYAVLPLTRVTTGLGPGPRSQVHKPPRQAGRGRLLQAPDPHHTTPRRRRGEDHSRDPRLPHTTGRREGARRRGPAPLRAPQEGPEAGQARRGGGGGGGGALKADVVHASLLKYRSTRPIATHAPSLRL